MSEQIAIVPAPRELVTGDGHWITADPAAEAVRTVVENLGETEYRIDVTTDGARLSAGSEDALRYAETDVPAAARRGEPADRRAASPYRRCRSPTRRGSAGAGVMLDVARHFMPKEFVLR